MQPRIYKVGNSRNYLLFSVHYGDGRETRLHIPHPSEKSVFETDDPLVLYRLCMYEFLDRGRPTATNFPSLTGNSVPIPYGDGRVAVLLFLKPYRARSSFTDRASFTKYVEEFTKILRRAMNSPDGVVDAFPIRTVTLDASFGKVLLSQTTA